MACFATLSARLHVATGFRSPPLSASVTMMQEGARLSCTDGDRVKIMWVLELQSLNRPLFFSEIRSLNYRVRTKVTNSEYNPNGPLFGLHIPAFATVTLLSRS